MSTPFGLVRSGVAPDHSETKIVTNQFSMVAQNERCSFFGNVSLGSFISLAELCDMYNADLAGIYAAREFVWWHNGHPDCRNLAPDLKSTDTAVILGQGNVALDVARILLRPTTELARTALAALQESSIRIKDLAIHIQQADLVTTPADKIEMKNNRIRRRVYELLSKAVALGRAPSPGQRELHFVFFHKPDKFLGSDDRSGYLVGVRLDKTTLKGDDKSMKQVAVGTGVYDDISRGLVLLNLALTFRCMLALKSIGYKSVAIDGLPFDN
ncbi:hypothetical protein BUALT_Bualt02G0143300 [Buddleja alternifolia]|uniref:NADPH:adrenodoxin oxidoreductase, mitochondrial n=1 Tax=Buddleja alternifolia TaxID=168488 RepID=A0AAV6Y784_9LAMI|nr:hypothetical protein BUALT_Bualt02G0143300 [Buddleja alternifolia]